MTLFHGSLYEIKSPQYLAGNPKNDYGLGFYCTENIELAKEWGCDDKKDGFANGAVQKEWTALTIFKDKQNPLW